MVIEGWLNQKSGGGSIVCPSATGTATGIDPVSPTACFAMAGIAGDRYERALSRASVRALLRIGGAGVLKHEPGGVNCGCRMMSAQHRRAVRTACSRGCEWVKRGSAFDQNGGRCGRFWLIAQFCGCPVLLGRRYRYRHRAVNSQ
jgi:hypothetical protein